MNSREFDLVVYGASGYTGRLTAQHFADGTRMGAGLRWAMAGRDFGRLAQVRDDISAGAASIIVADQGDAAALRSLVRRTRAVVTTVGPYQLHGGPLVAACAEAGTDYLDLSAEAPWIRSVIDTWTETARRTGARLVPCAGFDSIPSELGVLLVQQAAKARFGRYLPYVKGRILGLQSGISGGSAATAAAGAAAARNDPLIAALNRNPFALTPGFEGPPQPDARTVRYDPDIASEVGPFTMAPVNSKSVHRLNFLLGHPWGDDFRYDEMSAIRDGASVDFDTAGARRFSPGQGPSAEERAAGFFKIRYIGLGQDGERVSVLVEGDADPGYGATAKIFAEAATSLVKDCGDGAGGVWTPGAMMGDRLIARLQSRAGVRFTVEV